MRISKKIGLAILVATLSTATIIGCNKEKPKETPKVEAPAPKVKVTDYTVQKGDNLWNIAHSLYPENPKAYWVALNDSNYWDLKNYNSCGIADKLFVGYKLKLPEKYPVYEQPSGGGADMEIR